MFQSMYCYYLACDFIIIFHDFNTSPFHTFFQEATLSLLLKDELADDDLFFPMCRKLPHSLPCAYVVIKYGCGVYVWVCVGGVPGGAECHSSFL